MFMYVRSEIVSNIYRTYLTQIDCSAIIIHIKFTFYTIQTVEHKGDIGWLPPNGSIDGYCKTWSPRCIFF